MAGEVCEILDGESCGAAAVAGIFASEAEAASAARNTEAAG